MEQKRVKKQGNKRLSDSYLEVEDKEIEARTKISLLEVRADSVQQGANLNVV